MAEFGIASGALQVADAGLKLAKTLYNYLDAVRKADRELSTLAHEVTVTSTTLSSLGRVLQDNKTPALYTQELVDEAKLAFRSCEDAFKDVDATFKSVVRFDTDGKGHVNHARSFVNRGQLTALHVTSKGRWAWPLKKGKVDMLQANLERLKTTLLLMLSVLSFAKLNAESDRSDDSRVAVEKLQIDTLIKAQEDATTRYDELVASFTRLETHVTVTTNGFISMSTAQALPLTTERPTFVDGSVTGPDDAIRSQLSICVSAVSQLAQAFDTAAQSWNLGKIVEFTAINEVFDDVNHHLFHLRKLNQIGLLQRHCDARAAAANGPHDDAMSPTRRAPNLPEDERSSLVAQDIVQMQRPQYMMQQQQGHLNMSSQQLQQPQLSQSCSESGHATPTMSSHPMSSHHPPTFGSQGTLPQEQSLQDSSGEPKVQLALPLAEQLPRSQDDGMSMDIFIGVDLTADGPAPKRKRGRPPKTDKQTQEVTPTRKTNRKIYRPAKAQKLAREVVAAGQKDEAGSSQSPVSYPHVIPSTAGIFGNERTSNAVDALVRKWTNVAFA
ncbi:hypothetical protein LTR10_009702 [Elasticomyces elasticus]|nr:hypothetical protein LTR10_009702 [Elasticomyces elasticus]KAK4969991.1 hypothetical protein LTR42_008158 [Elasticomyces elasticus]